MGITLQTNEVLNILKKLNLSPKLNNSTITCTIPTYRGDLRIEEDLIEEVARIYGYNNFPKTLPKGSVREEKVPYFYDRDWEMKLKTLMISAGYSEIKTLSLQSKEIIEQSLLSIEKHIKIANPVSSDYEYLRSTLLPGLLSAVRLNSERQSLKLFEYGKVYFLPLAERQEPYFLGAVEIGGNFRTIKGLLDLLLQRLNINNVEIENSNFDIPLWYPGRSGIIKYDNIPIGIIGNINPQVSQKFGIKEQVYGLEIYSEKLKQISSISHYQPLSKYPAQIEDITLVIPSGVAVKNILNTISESSKLIKNIELNDIYNNSYTFRVRYQNPDSTLTDSEVENIRKIYLKELKEKYKVTYK